MAYITKATADLAEVFKVKCIINRGGGLWLNAVGGERGSEHPQVLSKVSHGSHMHTFAGKNPVQ